MDARGARAVGTPRILCELEVIVHATPRTLQCERSMRGSGWGCYGKERQRVRVWSARTVLDLLDLVDQHLGRVAEALGESNRVQRRGRCGV